MRLKESGHKGRIYSFDVGKCADHVIQTDIANVPLPDKKLDVVVFSLSLMGTNFPDFLASFPLWQKDLLLLLLLRRKRKVSGMERVASDESPT